MTDRKIAIRGQSVTFFVNGAKRREGVLLLYPGELIAVTTSSIGNWVYVLVPAAQITSVQCRKARKASSWLGIRKMTVTTADGTEYTFDGLMEQWHDHLVKALTARPIRSESA